MRNSTEFHCSMRNVDPGHSSRNRKSAGRTPTTAQLDGVQGQRLAEDVRVGCESLLPEAVAEHHRAGRALAVFLRQEIASQKWADAEEREEARRNVFAREVLGFAGPGEVEVIAAEGAHIGEGTAFAAPIEEIRVRHRALRELRRGLEDHQQPVRIGIRQRLQKHAVHHAENGRVRPDAQRQRQHRDGGEAGVLAQRAESVAKVLPKAGQDTSRSARCFRAPRTTGSGALVRSTARSSLASSSWSLTSSSAMRRASASVAPPLAEFPVTILGVLRQFLDNLRLARGGQVQVRQLLANRFIPVRHFRLP